MLDIVAAVNDTDILLRNLLRSPVVKSPNVKLHLQRGFRSAGLAYSSALAQCRNEYVAFVHQDVYLPARWEQQVLPTLTHLDKTDPSWAVLGVYGVLTSGEHVGHVWSSGLDRTLGVPFAVPQLVQSVDELLIIVRRSSGVMFDAHLPGYHLYGTDIVQAALSSGKSPYVIWAPVVHNSRPVLYLGDDFFQAYRYLTRKWRKKLPIRTCVLPIVRSPVFYMRKRFRAQVDKIRYRGIDRSRLDRKHDCVEISRKVGFE